MSSASHKGPLQFPDEELEILRSALRHLSEGVVIADTDGRFLICNDAAQAILAPASAGNPPRSWSEIKGCYKADGATPCPPGEMPHALALAGRTVPETELFIRNEQCPSGVWVAMQARPLRNARGDLRGSIVAFHDVTKKKETDLLVRTLSNAVEQTADSILIANRSGVIEYVNPAFELTTGYRREEVEGLTPRILKSGVHDDAFYARLWDTILSGNVFRDTLANKKKSGEIFYAEQTITPMRGANGDITHFVTVIKDVTEQKQMEAQRFQMGLARAVQQQFYSMPPPKVDGFDIAGAAFPADETGGDYFDFVPLPEDRVGIVIGDACGHGIGAALLMVELRAYFRAFVQQTSEVDKILSLINNALVTDLELNRYATLIFCRLEPASRSVVYANAGHTPGYILDAAGEVKRTLTSTDIPLGFLPGHTFTCSEPFTLEPGEILALLTDGITEAERPDHSFFGVEGALDFLRRNLSKSAREMVDGLYQAVRSFADGMPQADDITVVICKALGEGPQRAAPGA